MTQLMVVTLKFKVCLTGPNRRADQYVPPRTSVLSFGTAGHADGTKKKPKIASKLPKNKNFGHADDT